MRKIKAKKATNKEIEFFISQISKLDVLDFIGIAKLCGVKLLKDEVEEKEEVEHDAATVIENGDEAKKPEARDFYEILLDIVNYYKDSKKERRQTLINIVIDCAHVNKKRGGKNGKYPSG